ncbi:hypothetical protein [Paraburkholderia sp. J10-1]|uniref:hypothetical protein n=1 Tax=Paraburkholderia sp. J10-1 TaxID=2805430 RepID=UPI002AB781F5|nr:hypothetical protein [Paraburkholderia sp. J10-1]
MALLGNMVAQQVAAQSVSGKTPFNMLGTGDTSALYGVGGDVNTLVAQASGYSSDAGGRFASIAGWNLALQGDPAAGGAGSYVGETISPYGGAAFNMQQARIERVAEMQLQAANPVDVRPALGELNILVAGIGSCGDGSAAVGEIRALPPSMRDRLSDASVADTPGGALLGLPSGSGCRESGCALYRLQR